MKIRKITSSFDNLELEAAFFEPECAPRAIVCFSHGMAEHKERYYDFMRFLSTNGYICVIHDHRGHGASVRSDKDYGYFYTEDSSAIVEDLFTVVEFSKALYPGLPVYLFSHSMGTLVARCFLKNHDDAVDKVVLCGPPTRNNVVGAGLALANMANRMGKGHEPNVMLNNIALGSYNKGASVPNAWLSVNKENVDAYNMDPLCGFTFTTNGFINLFKLQRDSFISTDWNVKHPDLPIFVIAGSNDPCIVSEAMFKDLIYFLKYTVGYSNVYNRLYIGKRHEILNEYNHEETYRDVLTFFNNDRPVM